MVKAAVAAGLEPIALVSEPPDWAAAQGIFGRNYEPSPSELKLFATALPGATAGPSRDSRASSTGACGTSQTCFYLEPQSDKA